MENKSIIIFASGNGRNAENIMRYFADSSLAEVTSVLTNNPEAGVRGVAEEESIANEIVDFAIADEQHVSDEMAATLQRYDVEMICLAGFMRKIPAEITRRYHDKILNIHPSLLPSYGGKGMYGHHVHAAVLAAGKKESGIIIHLVDEIYDNGKILFQARCPVEPDDTIERLLALVGWLLQSL